MRNYFLLAVLIFLSNCLFSQTRLPAMFSDNMVLQQQQMVSVWGVDNPNAKITVLGSWGKNATAITDAKGHWKLKLQTPAAGGPYTVVIKGSKEVTLKNVLIGEVWFCSGQSNMEMPVKGYSNQPVIGSNETILNSSNDNIRFLNTSRSASITPLYDVKGEWNAAGPATTGNFSATAYYFAKKLQSVLNVPVGIIQSAWGASTIESWMDKQSLSEFKNKIIPNKLPDSIPNRTPTIMYNSMLHPYIGYTIKGVLWYQGESNRENASEYYALFTSMINSWRKQWQQDDFPLYFVQIAPIEPGKVNAAFLREAQLQTMLSVKNTGMAVTMDIGERTVIHPAQKEQVGNRLAYWALAKDYNVKGIAFSGPVYRQLEKTANGRLMLTFDYCDQGLTSFGKPLTDFEIAGEDKVFYPAQAMIRNDKNGVLVVWSDAVKEPVSVRYAFKNWAEGSLFNTQGLPASSFRTDNW
ncbi:sialate O-acetylesterase [Lacibacter sp.]|uniref:sialate O-acetylesterase n=1 Tax=Lacibacter sp. TaxID=1915409 RepID=UPI002B4AF2CF|nr:sialate O-acetylesterase [Lacibacter sp.]HLP36031.1 sialate O-acetylesterase [Lacibacter sp.]